MIRFAVILCLLALAACGSPSYRENAADIKAGIEAARQESDAVKRAAIYEAVAQRTWAMLASIDDLPAPTVTATEIRADVPAYAASGAAVEASPPEFDTLTDKEPKPSPADIVRGIGERVLTYSVWFALLGIVVLALRFVPWWGVGAIARLAPIAAAATLSAAGGAVSSIAGTAAIWLADYWGLVVAITVISAVVAWIAYAKRTRIVEAAMSAHRRLAGKG